jgi:hypothetical protein
MTEAEWLAATDRRRWWSTSGQDDRPEIAAHRLWLLSHGMGQTARSSQPRAVEVVESFADGLARGSALRLAYRAASRAADDPSIRADFQAGGAARCGVDCSPGFGPEILVNTAPIFLLDPQTKQFGRAQAELVRCVFGNPFRPVTVDSSWRTSTVVALAAQMYGSRDFSAMPILADALQDAGCEDEDVLTTAGATARMSGLLGGRSAAGEGMSHDGKRSGL